MHEKRPFDHRNKYDLKLKVRYKKMDIVKMNFDRIYEALNSRISADMEKDQMHKITIVFFSECFGSVGHQHFNAYKVEKSTYAQYKNAIRVYVKKKGGRNGYILTLHEGKTFAVIDGWVEPSEPFPMNYLSFDNELFARIVDSCDGEKIAENSDRQKQADREAEGQEIERTYIVVTHEGVEHFETEAALLTKYQKTGVFHDTVRRAEIQDTPILAGLFGAMYDGVDKYGRAVCRYEDKQTYAEMSE